MKITKANNRHYGQYFEQALESIINNEVIQNKTGFTFPQEHTDIMCTHAKKLANYLNSKEAKRVGDKTSNESCDLKIDGQEIELKYVGSGSGTYFNTSMEYIVTLGFPSYHSCLEMGGYIEALKGLFGDKVKEDNISPVSNADSSFIRANYPEVYTKLSAWEGKIRALYVKEFFNFLQQNPDKKAQFITDMITKDVSGKHIPDRLIVFNHSSETITDWSKKYLTSLADNDIINLSGKYSINFGNAKATFAWQNGTGLNNPTIRVFI